MSTARLHVLGSTGYHENQFRKTSCLAIPEFGLVLDAGSGFYRLRGLLPEFPETLTVQILLSHAHLDHVSGIPNAITTFYGQSRTRCIWARAEDLETIETHLLAPRLFPMSLERLGYARSQVVPGSSYVVNGIPLQTIPLPHPGGSVGYRFSLPGHELAYITDTSASAVPTEFVAGVDTLIHECNFSDDFQELARQTGHSYLGEVLELASNAGVKRLVLTHCNNFPEMESGEFCWDLANLGDRQVPFELIESNDNTVIDLV